MDDAAEFSKATKRRMFEMGMPVGSDVPEAQRMGAPPLHLCDPDVACDLCGSYPTSDAADQRSERAVRTAE